MNLPPPLPLLGEAQVSFITGEVAIVVASSDAALLPAIARGYGCRVATDRRTVTVFLPAENSDAVLRNLRAGRPIAAVFTFPATHETLQLKGAHADVGPLKRGDRALMRSYAQQITAHLRGLGFTDAFLGAMGAPVEYEAVAATFVPAAAFVQTPGPSAGQPLQPKP